ncbi:MAG: hypothetical protein IPM79_20630 [Polyangiaceae bacterium]|nr:hypothetical protein [Polyangiaceae bacterium]
MRVWSSAPGRGMLSSRVKIAPTAALVALAIVACAQPTPPAVAPKPAGSSAAKAAPADELSEKAFGLPAAVPRLRFMPDVDGSRGVLMRTGEGELALIGRMRVATSPTGVMERADELLPQGRIVAQRLPTRLGGGFLFLAATGRGTELWRSASWLGPLEPLVGFSQVAHNERPITMGFDRIYLRFSTLNELTAIDPKSGGLLPYGSLPVAPGYGELLFLDGWRAVVDADIVGTLATYDAGATWRPIGVKGRVRGIIPSSGDPDDGEEAIVQVDGGSYRVGAGGHVTFTPSGPLAQSFATPRTPATALKPGLAKASGPIGKKPLRVVLERGYPDSATTALVAANGALARVSLESGAVLDVTPHAYPDEYAECSGVALGDKGRKPEQAVGFVCGSAEGGTVVYALEPPLSLREVMRFEEPRVVTESGQGALVVRGPCAGKDDPGASVRPFCVRFADGSSREIRIRGEVGAERVVALQDGRVVIIVPPRSGTQGQISILEGKGSKHIVLKMPEGGAPREVETGMWLEGFHQTGQDEVGGWIEAGGPTFGVRIKLDGQVTIGNIVDEPGGVLVGGRFGLAIGERGHLLETIDTGQTWRELDLPRVDDPSEQLRARRCSAVGCVFPGWLKIGWGEPAREDDLREAAAPATVKISSLKLSSGPVSLSCKSGPAAPKAKASTTKMEGTAVTGWAAHEEVEAPSLKKGDVGIDNGAPYDLVPIHAYVWGKKESDWSRTGRFLIRYTDRFSLEQVRSSAVTTSPWASETAASDAFGLGNYGYGYNAVAWSAQRDQGAALVGACRGRVCSLFAVEPEQPVLSLRTTESGGLSRPHAGSAVKVGQVWFYLGDPGIPEQVTLYRADLGHVRQVASYRRLMSPRFAATTLPKLVRRAKTDQLGLAFVLREGPTDKRGVRYVLPLDPDTGELGEPVRLGRPDLADVEISSGCGDRDGWLLELPFDPPPNISLDTGATTLDSVELRLRMDPGKACIDAGAAALAFFTGGEKPKPSDGKLAPASSFPMMVADRSSFTRRQLSCEAKPKLSFP